MAEIGQSGKISPLDQCDQMLDQKLAKKPKTDTSKITQNGLDFDGIGKWHSYDHIYLTPTYTYTYFRYRRRTIPRILIPTLTRRIPIPIPMT